MKILIVRMFPSKVNINNYNVQEIGLAKALIRKGNECDIVFSNLKEDNKFEELVFDNDKKIGIHWIKLKDFFGNAIYDDSLYDIAEKYDVIQTSEYSQIGNLLLYKKISKPIVIYHGPYESVTEKKDMLKDKIYDLLFLNKLKSYNPKIIVKSKLAYDYLKSKKLNDVKIVGVGLDDDKFKNEVECNEQTKNILNRIGNDKFILYIGQIQERRNTKFLIDTYKKVFEEDNNVKLVLIGKGEKQYVDECKEMIQKYNIENNVIFEEKLEQKYIKYIFEKASAFLLPTNYEIFGMVLLEAMYFGVPAITTYNGGSSTLIENEKDGYICEQLDIDLWKNTILNVVNKDTKEISENARNKIHNEFMWNNLVNKFIDVYKEAINK